MPTQPGDHVAAICERILADKLLDTMVSQNMLFVHNARSKFTYQANAAIVDLYCEGEKVVALAAIKDTIKAVDLHFMKKISGTNVKGGMMYQHWVKNNAKIGKILFVARRRQLGRAVPPTTKIEKKKKCKFMTKIIKLKKKRKVSGEFVRDDMDKATLLGQTYKTNPHTHLQDNL